MSDAFHLLSDVASFIVALAAIYLAEKPATKRKQFDMTHCGFYYYYCTNGCCINFIIAGHTFGFHRAEVIAALVSVFTIWILTAFLVREAIERIKNPQQIDAKLVSQGTTLLVLFCCSIKYISSRCVLLLPLVWSSTLCKFDSFLHLSCFAHAIFHE